MASTFDVELGTLFFVFLFLASEPLLRVWVDGECSNVWATMAESAAPSLAIAIVGSRAFNDYALLCKHMEAYAPTLIVSGGAQGADSLGEKWAKEKGVATRILRPNWTKYGKAAGFMRNTDIIQAADVVIAFWDQTSRGTQDSIQKAQAAGKKVVIVTF